MNRFPTMKSKSCYDYFTWLEEERNEKVEINEFIEWFIDNELYHNDDYEQIEYNHTIYKLHDWLIRELRIIAKADKSYCTSFLWHLNEQSAKRQLDHKDIKDVCEYIDLLVYAIDNMEFENSIIKLYDK